MYKLYILNSEFQKQNSIELLKIKRGIDSLSKFIIIRL